MLLKVLAYKRLALQFCEILDKMPKPLIKDIKHSSNYPNGCHGCYFKIEEEKINPKFEKLENQIDKIIQEFIEEEKK